MDPDTPVTTLVALARNGDQAGWDALVDRYGPVVIAVCRRFRLPEADAADVRQTVWLRLLENLGNLRTVEALPGWLVTTTRRECLKLRRLEQRTEALPERFEPMDRSDAGVVDDRLLRAERQAAMRAAFADLPPRCQQLLRLLMSDPPVPYEEISRQLGIPVGGIGPTRARCLRRLRESPVLVALTEDVDVEPARDR
jgi:RNA polymerase sigma factor (sigma-70 family)